MIESTYAVITRGTMTTSRGTPNPARFAEFEGDGAATKVDDAFADGGECGDGRGVYGGARDDARVGSGCQVGGRDGDGEGDDHGDGKHDADRTPVLHEPGEGDGALGGEDGHG